MMYLYPMNDSGKTQNLFGTRFAQKDLTPSPRNKIAARIQFKFIELCKKYVGIIPVRNKPGYILPLRAMDKGVLTEEQIYDLFEEWFALGKPDDETVQITRALSDIQINGYKARNHVG